jgi:hypothetical protein
VTFVVVIAQWTTNKMTMKATWVVTDDSVAGGVADAVVVVGLMNELYQWLIINYP